MDAPHQAAALGTPVGLSLVLSVNGAVEAGLAEGGWVDGGSVAIEWRYGGGQRERLRPIAEELVRLQVDALFAPGALGVAAARQATTTIPIVGVDLDLQLLVAEDLEGFLAEDRKSVV